MTQLPVSQVEPVYNLFKIEDLTPVASLQNDDLFVINVLSAGGIYRTSNINVGNFVSHLRSLGFSTRINVVDSLPTDAELGDICTLRIDSRPYFHDGSSWKMFILS